MVNQTIVAVARMRGATILEFQVCEILAVAVAVVADFGVWKRLAVGLMAPLQESVLHLVAKHCVCVYVLALALVLALTVALAVAVAVDLALARENYL